MRRENGPGDDFHIKGNAFGAWVEPGIVWVLKDENRNGKADDTWYELKGNAEELLIPVIRRYAVTYYRSGAWEDNLGNTGTCGPLQKYPSSWPDSVTLAGTMLDRSNSSVMGWDLKGYVDTTDEFYDIDDAVQADGSPVSPPLDCTDFIRIQTGEHVYSGALGEISTEIAGGSQGIGSVWNEDRTLNGVSGEGGYAYNLVNNSGYDITVFFRDVAGTLSVPRGQTVPYASAESKLYYDYSGGNVHVSRSGGNTLTFTDV
jgi:hypothetical protein